MSPQSPLQELDERWRPHWSDLDLSPWSRSRARRVFEVTAVIASAPVLLPLVLLIAMAVGATSGFPILFRQKRKGALDSTFQILKFRTMRLSPHDHASAIAVESAHRITRLGAFLRRTKLDELPQLWNVLRGEMSLVGPRPKVPEQQSEPLPCRPGLTGVAALAFVREESVLQDLAPELVTSFFHQQMLPAKHRLDVAYMAEASLGSDLRIILDTVMGRWRPYAMDLELSAPRRQPDEMAKEVSVLYQ
jgi:lipopolysaccharide/colanic/teichoic acid biosynthesis glycosyltransferase